ncbi:hypothetical protein PKHYL_09520 [Psychrobacter sp. KH172YL61]|nr:hypothetical protein PKHYL_09520 [Psychrobacter sp. KH172YL61]
MSNTNNATNQIGLEKADMSEVIAQLNNLLSTYHVFYLNVRGYHWNVKVSTSLLCIQSLKNYTHRYSYRLMRSLSVF